MHSAQPGSVARGATLELISCWDLGWHDRATALAQEQPSLLTLKRGEAGGTPMHAAVGRDDIVLLQVLIAGHPDLSVTDDQYHSTPLGWAEFMGRTRAAEWLRAASEGDARPVYPST